MSIFTTVPGPQDYILYDAAIHASVHDGMRASRTASSHRRPFRHNSVESLREELLKVVAEQQSSSANIIVAVESLYSMDGDLCPLKEMLDAAENIVPSREGRLHFILDEAHSTGTFGPQGRGWAAHLGVEHRLAMRLHTFGKAMASQGGEPRFFFFFFFRGSVNALADCSGLQRLSCQAHSFVITVRLHTRRRGWHNADA